METVAADGDTRWTCDRCARDLDRAGEVVELWTDEERDGPPDAWLCGGCYEGLLAAASVTPVRVWKDDGRRSVVATPD